MPPISYPIRLAGTAKGQRLRIKSDKVPSSKRKKPRPQKCK